MTGVAIPDGGRPSESEELSGDAFPARTRRGRIWGRDVTMVGDVARLVGATTRAVRHYERIGLIQPERDRANHRIYGEKERSRLRIIAVLRAAGVPLKGIAEVLRASDRGVGGRLALQLLHDRRVALSKELDRMAELEHRVACLPELWRQ